MIIKIITSSLLVPLLITSNVSRVQARQAFQNLDFESGSTSGAVNFQVPITQALPGWGVSINGSPAAQVIVNAVSTGAASVDLLSPGEQTGVGAGVIDGNYTVFLQAFNPAQGDVSLYQTGTVPANAQSLQFRAWDVNPGAGLAVSLGGNSLSPLLLSTGQSPAGQPYNVYGVNIGSYAGQTTQVEFTALDNNPPGWIELDDITFSPTATPEPSTLALLLTGGGVLAVRRWRGKKQ
jgi:hypothetical protein